MEFLGRVFLRGVGPENNVWQFIGCLVFVNEISLIVARMRTRTASLQALRRISETRWNSRVCEIGRRQWRTIRT